MGKRDCCILLMLKKNKQEKYCRLRLFQPSDIQQYRRLQKYQKRSLVSGTFGGGS